MAERRMAYPVCQDNDSAELKGFSMDTVVKSDAEWRAQLSDLAYKVTR